MSKYFVVFFIIYLILGCKDKSIELSKNRHIETEKKQDKDINIEKQQKEVLSDEYAYLFFPKSNFITYVKPSKSIIKNEILMNSSDLKVIVDWQVEGGRYIRLRNNKTGNVFTINEGDKSGEIILVERNLRYYLFRIENTIIKVPR